MKYRERGLCKPERLYLREEIQALFSSKEAFMAYPMRVVYYFQSSQRGEPKVRLLISIPKKRLRHAVDRNKVKRLFREAFRDQKKTLSEMIPDGLSLALGFIYVSETVCDYKQAVRSIDKTIFKLKDKCLIYHNDEEM